MILSTIGFDDLRIFCVIGVNPDEQKEKQPLFLDLKVMPSSLICNQTDSLEDTIDYRDLVALCEKILEEGHYHLLEKAAHDILKKLFSLYSLKWAFIRIKKPNAIRDAKWVIVEMEMGEK